MMEVRSSTLQQARPRIDLPISQDLHNIGGIPAVVKFLLKETDLLDGSTMTVTGQTLAENVADGTSSFPRAPSSR